MKCQILFCTGEAWVKCGVWFKKFPTWRHSPLYLVLKLNVFSGGDPWQRDETDFLHFASLTGSGERWPGPSKHDVLANSNSKTVSTPWRPQEDRDNRIVDFCNQNLWGLHYTKCLALVILSQLEQWQHICLVNNDDGQKWSVQIDFTITILTTGVQRMVDVVAVLADRGCLHIIFRILAHLDSWDLQVRISIIFITKTKPCNTSNACNFKN